MHSMKVPVHKTLSCFCVAEFVKPSHLPVDAICMSVLQVLPLSSVEPGDQTFLHIYKLLCQNLHEMFSDSDMLCVCVIWNGHSDYTVTHVNSDKQPGI